MASLIVVPLIADLNCLANLPYQGDTPAQLRQFAHALAYSPLWPEEAVLVVLGESPHLTVLGFFDEASRARLENLRYQLENVLPTLRYLDYEAVTAACQRLADRLSETLSAEELANATFVALPRGGLIVLGILSYLLGLKPGQLEPQTDDNGLVVVVDDCALSGLRFGQFKARYGHHKLVFATLFSPLELREVLEAEATIRCISAHDLSDHARERLGDEYAAWQARWRERSPDAYFIGQPEQIAFPWNEPDASFWNPVTAREESGWHFLTPEACLKHRYRPQRVPVYVQPRMPGPIRPTPSVLYGRLGERVLLGDLQTGEGFALENVAADVWEMLMQHGTVEASVLALENMYQVDRVTLRSDLHALVDELECRGLLSRA